MHFMQWNLIIMIMTKLTFISCSHHYKKPATETWISLTNNDFICLCNTGETATTYHFKTLVPSVAAGAIIGKGGETIASLQKDAGARVKMSKSHDFYPGERAVWGAPMQTTAAACGELKGWNWLDFCPIESRPPINILNDSPHFISSPFCCRNDWTSLPD